MSGPLFLCGEVSVSSPALTGRRRGLLTLSIHDLLTAITFIAIFTMAVRVPLAPDTWWHLRAGQYILDTHSIPVTDPFSHTKAGDLWINHGWLAQIFWYALFSIGGPGALALGVAALVTTAFWFAWKQIEANIFVATFVTILGAIVSAVAWVARPQMVSFTLTAVVAYLLHRFKRDNGRLLPWLPLLMLLWANIHGGFAIGFMLMLAYLVGEVMNHITGHQADPVIPWARLRHLGLVILLSLAVVVVNPHTWRMWLYPFQTVGIGALRDFIQEWQSPDFHALEAQPFVVMLLLLLVALGRTRRAADWTDLTLAALWLGWALFAGRNIAIFGLVVTPILARYADAAWSEQWQAWGRQRVPFANASTYRGGPLTVLNWLLLILIAGAALVKIALPLDPQISHQVEQTRFPYEAVEFIKEERPPGPLFNDYNWGGYLIFKLWPDYPVYIDGRTDLYDDAFIRRYISVMVADEGWPQILDEAGINTVMIGPESTLAKFMSRDPAWREIYRDGQAVIFSRSQHPE